MATKVIHTIFLLKRGTEAQWTTHNPILRSGEPGFVTDRNILKIGNGETPFLDLPPIAGGGGSSDLPVFISNPEKGQVLTYNPTTQVWQNVWLNDDASLTFNPDGKLELSNYNEAEVGQMPVKTETGLEWKTAATTEQIDDAADRASNAAIEAGNYAIDAAESAEAAEKQYDKIQRALWMGTRADYNELPSINPGTLYVIREQLG